MSAQPPLFANASICNNCQNSIGFFRNRRHHCRNCGNSFCASCSAKTSSIPEFGIEDEVRVCNSCFKQIQVEIERKKAPRRSSSTRFSVSFGDVANKTECPECFKDRVEDWALKNCGHVICGACLSKIDDCPICGKEAVGAIRIYINS